MNKAAPKKNPYCVYPQCPQAAGNARTVCGEGSARTQSGRSMTQLFCPGCKMAFHTICYMMYHRLQTERE